MKNLIFCLLLFVGVSLLTYCQFEKAMPFLTLNFKGQSLSLELALTDEHQTKGLMFHKPIQNNEGMLFVYEVPDRMYYWNPNVSFNIDLGYFDGQGRLMSIHHLKAMDETSIDSIDLVTYVLEMREGWFKEKNIKVGEVWPELLTWKASRVK
jgi:uncharacterized membrane protein (UPF0127 family)